MKHKSVLFTVVVLASVICEPECQAQWKQVSPFPHELLGVDKGSFFAWADTGLYRSTNSGVTWLVDTNGVRSYYSYSFSSPLEPIAFVRSGPNLLVSTLDGIFISTNDGVNWDTTCTINQQSTVLAFATEGNTIFAGGDPYWAVRFFISTDDGNSWTIGNLPNESSIQCMVVDGGELFIGTTGRIGTHLYVSNDNGTNWKYADSGMPSAFCPNAFAILDSDLFVGTGVGGSGPVGSEAGGIYKSTNNGVSWMEMDKGLPDSTNVNCFAVFGQAIVAGTEAGIFLSTDGGKIWSAENGGLTDLFINSLEIFGGDLYAGTDSAGVWRRPLSDFGISSVSEHAPMNAETLTAYPNPATNSTMLHFTTPPSGNATVTVVNALGVCVMRNANSVMHDGSVTLNLSGLSAGMYECIVQVDGKEMCVPILVE